MLVDFGKQSFLIQHQPVDGFRLTGKRTLTVGEQALPPREMAGEDGRWEVVLKVGSRQHNTASSFQIRLKGGRDVFKVL